MFLAIILCLAPSVSWAEDAASALRLIRAYPEADMKLEETDGSLYIRINGASLLFEPATGCPSPRPDAKEDQALCSTLIQHYPTGENGRYPEPGFDPGRTRNQALFRQLYGATQEEVRIQCEEVSFLGESVLFSSRHGASAALERVAKRLEAETARDPALLAYILPSPGAFFWRTIEKSERLSPHSFGIALDLNVSKGPYWRWAEASSPAVRKARENYPQAIVDAFEAEGFIWGGKWSHFDFMHFEYRPELTGR